MQKLMTCAMKCGQSRPNVSAVSLAVLARSLPMLANKIK